MQIEKMLFISLCGIKLLYRVLSFHPDGIPLMFLVGQVSEGPMSLFLSIWKHLHKSQFLLHFWKIILTVIEFLIWIYLSLSYLKFSDSCMCRLMFFFKIKFEKDSVFISLLNLSAVSLVPLLLGPP